MSIRAQSGLWPPEALALQAHPPSSPEPVCDDGARHRERWVAVVPVGVCRDGTVLVISSCGHRISSHTSIRFCTCISGTGITPNGCVRRRRPSIATHLPGRHTVGNAICIITPFTPWAFSVEAGIVDTLTGKTDQPLTADDTCTVPATFPINTRLGIRTVHLIARVILTFAFDAPLVGWTGHICA